MNKKNKENFKVGFPKLEFPSLNMFGGIKK